MNAAFSLQVEQSLRNLGFTRHEVKALVYLVRVKQATAKQLSREGTIPFTMAQSALANLERRSLVTVEQNGQDHYTFAGQEAFDRWLNEEQSKHQDIYAQAGKDMSQLFDSAKGDSWQPEVLFYEGRDGIREIYDDMLATGEDIYTCTDLEKLIGALSEEYIENFIQTRKEKNMKLYTIRSKRTNDLFSKQESMAANELREIKVISDLKLDGEIKVYGKKSALVTLDGDKPVGFVFSGGPIAKLMKQFFDQLWKNL